MESILNRIRYIHWLYKARNQYRKLKWNEVYLIDGTYYVTCNQRTYLVKEGIPDDFLAMLGVDVRKFRLKAIKISNTHTEKALFNGDIAMSTNNGYRYFNYKNKESFRRFVTVEEAEMYKLAQDAFSRTFNLTVKKYTHRYCIETIIENKPRYKWNEIEIEDNFKKLFISEIEYLRQAEKHICAELCKDKDEVKVYNRLESLYETLLEDIKPVSIIKTAFVHGDMHFGNTLFDGENIYIIDFEMASENVFFYDVFNIMYVEYTDMRNPGLVNAYFSHDDSIMSLFKLMFNVVDEEFEERNILNYFEVYLLLRLKSSIKDSKKKFIGEDLDRAICYNVDIINKVLTEVKQKCLPN